MQITWLLETLAFQTCVTPQIHIVGKRGREQDVQAGSLTYNALLSYDTCPPVLFPFYFNVATAAEADPVGTPTIPQERPHQPTRGLG